MVLSIRDYRFQNIALVDYISTIICAFIMSAYTSYPLTLVTIFLFSISIPFHFIFNIETSTNNYIKKNFGWKYQ